jgi:hypothetical protein
LTEATELTLLHPLRLSSNLGEVAALLVNIALTQCLESVSFIHATSLRSELIQEGRLQFNTNIRLFSSTIKHGPNKWYSNTFAAALLVLSYASTSLLFLQGRTDTVENSTNITYLNTAALLALGLGLLGHVILSTWSLFRISDTTPCIWLSNPLATTMAALYVGVTKHRPREV